MLSEGKKRDFVYIFCAQFAKLFRLSREYGQSIMYHKVREFNRSVRTNVYKLSRDIELNIV